MAYARIEEGFWTDPKIKALPLEGKMVAAWLFTNPHRHFSGLYYLPIVLIPHEIGLSIGVSEKMLNLLEEQGFIKYSHEFSVVWVVTMLKHQSGGKDLSTQQTTGIKNHLKTLHGCPLIDEFVNKYKSLGVNYDGKIDTPTDTPTDIKSQSQSQKDLPPPTPPFGGNGKRKGKRVKPQPSFSPDFEIFWDAYPNSSGGKDKTWERWQLRKEAGSLPPIEYLLESVSRLSLSPKWQEDNGKYIPMITTFINQGRWTDAGAIKPGKGSAPPKARNPDCPRCRGSGLYQSGKGPDGAPIMKSCKCDEISNGPEAT